MHTPGQAHGFIYCKLNRTALSNTAFAEFAIKARQEGDASTHVEEVSRMADPEAPDKDGTTRPGTDVIVSVTSTAPQGYWVAHEQIAGLGVRIAALTDGNSQNYVGLANHWCCYSDQ